MDIASIEYWRQVKENLLGQIANAARNGAWSSFVHDFGRAYFKVAYFMTAN